MTIDILVRLKRALLPLAAAVAVTLSVSTTVYAVTGGLSGKPDSNSPFSAIYIIGDSLSDTGRTSAVLSQSGTSFPPVPYAPGRMSNGAVWIEYFAPLVRLSYNPLDNFAWAGATTGTANTFALPNTGMLNQLKELRELYQLRLDPNALYVVFGGTNDFQLINLPLLENAAGVLNNATDNLTLIVHELYQYGARNIVVVNIADLGTTPYSRSLQLSGFATQFSATFNRLLDQKLATLGFPIAKVNLFDLSRDFVDKPKKYGFTNVTDQSFPDLTKGESYLFWDQLHPTTRAHRYLADEIFQTVAKAGMFKGKLK
jgi:phospholipase/lecithinase/hemolysin